MYAESDTTPSQQRAKTRAHLYRSVSRPCHHFRPVVHVDRGVDVRRVPLVVGGTGNSREGQQQAKRHARASIRAMALSPCRKPNPRRCACQSMRRSVATLGPVGWAVSSRNRAGRAVWDARMAQESQPTPPPVPVSTGRVVWRTQLRTYLGLSLLLHVSAPEIDITFFNVHKRPPARKTHRPPAIFSRKRKSHPLRTTPTSNKPTSP